MANAKLLDALAVNTWIEIKNLDGMWQPLALVT